MYKVAIIALSLVLTGLQLRLWVLDGGYAEIHRLNAKIADLTAYNEKMRKRNADLHGEIADLKSGVAAIEGRARTRLGMIRPGEQFYLIDDGGSNRDDSIEPGMTVARAGEGAGNASP
ncbi:MAG: septum formation initiator family protein [Salinisphaera sp.]|nr:septum formation initiator family protein [Salinisphaera sp.]